MSARLLARSSAAGEAFTSQQAGLPVSIFVGLGWTSESRYHGVMKLTGLDANGVARDCGQFRPHGAFGSCQVQVMS